MDREQRTGDDSKAIYWIAGVIATALLSLFTIIYADMQAKSNKLEDRITRSENSNIEAQKEISRLKADISYIRESIADIKNSQQQIMILLGRRSNDDPIRSR